MRWKHVTLLEAALPFLLVVASATTTTATAAGACPDGCNGRGDCIKGICVCSRPFTGTACEGEGDLSASAETIDAVGGFPEPASSFSGDDSSAAAGATITTARRDDDNADGGYGSNHGGDGAESGGVAAVPKTLTICLVTAEVVGPVSNGGIGTAMTTLAHTLTAAGHKVTILFTMGPVSQYGPFESWVEKYREQGIELIGLWRPGLRYIPRHLLESYEVYRVLRDRHFDVVHFHDYQGAGYYSLLAKTQGLAMHDVVTVIGLHGPNKWAKEEGNQEAINRVGDLEMDYMERRSVAMADHVVSPSRYLLGWMARQGWPANSASVVQPNVLPLADRRSPSLGPRPEGPASRVTVDELVFFARLETRKGVITFCDAIERLLSGQSGEPSLTSQEAVLAKLKQVTFLGRGAMVHGKFGVHYVQERAQRWPVPWKIIARMGPVEAKSYLREGPRLAVMPSRIENSPYTVYECAELGIPFVAAAVGGVPDLVHSEDHEEALFEPTVEELAARMGRALSRGVRPARPRVDAALNERSWVAWHTRVVEQAAEKRKNKRHVREEEEEEEEEDEMKKKTKTAAAETETVAGAGAGAAAGEGSEAGAVVAAAAVGGAADAHLPFMSVVMTHFNRPRVCRQAIQSVRDQDYPQHRMELILVDDASTDPDVAAFLDDIQPEFDRRGWTIIRSRVNQYLGGARNTGFKASKGEYVVFMDDDNYAKPHEVRTFATAMTRGGADILTSFVQFFWSAESPLDAEEVSGDRPSYLFLGGDREVGAFKNCFGDANCCVKRTSFEAIGGYTEDKNVGFEDWEMYANATLRGYRVDIVPESIYYYRFTKGSMQRSTDYLRNRRRSLRPYLNSLPSEVHPVLLQAVFPKRADGTVGRPVGLAEQGDARFHGFAEPEGAAPDGGGGGSGGGGNGKGLASGGGEGEKKDEL